MKKEKKKHLKNIPLHSKQKSSFTSLSLNKLSSSMSISLLVIEPDG